MTGVKFCLGDITNGEDILRFQQTIGLNQVDCVLSDVAPDVTGDANYDNYHVTNLNNHVVAVANRILRPGGSLLMKTFYGPDESANFKFFQTIFKELHRVKPNASRKRSSELYYLGKGYKLTEYFEKLSKVKPENMNFEEFYEMFPKEFTKSREEFRKKLIIQSKFLEQSGIESRIHLKK